MRARLMCRTGELSGNTHDVTADIVLGRDSESGVVIQSGLISGRHARIRMDGKGFVLEDLGSANGTWVDGERVVQPVRLDHLNVITLAQTFDFIFLVEARASAIALPPASPQASPRAPSPPPTLEPPLAQRTVQPPVPQPAPPIAPPLAPPPALKIAPPLAPPGANETAFLSGGFGAMPPLQKEPLAPAPVAGGETIDLRGQMGGMDGNTINMDFGAIGIPKLEPKAPVAFHIEITIPNTPNHTVELTQHQRYTIGRAQDCDIPIQEKHVSEHHATLFVSDVVMLEDAGSSNGTKVNGHLISKATEILPGTTFMLGVTVSVKLSRR